MTSVKDSCYTLQRASTCVVCNHAQILTFQDSSQSHSNSNHKRKATTYSKKKMDQHQHKLNGHVIAIPSMKQPKNSSALPIVNHKVWFDENTMTWKKSVWSDRATDIQQTAGQRLNIWYEDLNTVYGISQMELHRLWVLMEWQIKAKF